MIRVAAGVMVALLTGISGVWAHGGGLDRCGGHHDRKAGGYHVHNWAQYCACYPKDEGCIGKATISAVAEAPTAAAPTNERAVATTQANDAQGETVYVTKTGTKYHRAGCRSLVKSAIPITLKEAAARYGACSLCSPPTISSDPVQAGTASPAPARSQCAAITKAGKRCSRTAAEGSSYCWQHGK